MYIVLKHAIVKRRLIVAPCKLVLAQVSSDGPLSTHMDLLRWATWVNAYIINASIKTYYKCIFLIVEQLSYMLLIYIVFNLY